MHTDRRRTRQTRMVATLATVATFAALAPRAWAVGETLSITVAPSSPITVWCGNEKDIRFTVTATPSTGENGECKITGHDYSWTGQIERGPETDWTSHIDDTASPSEDCPIQLSGTTSNTLTVRVTPKVAHVYTLTVHVTDNYTTSNCGNGTAEAQFEVNIVAPKLTMGVTESSCDSTLLQCIRCKNSSGQLIDPIAPSGSGTVRLIQLNYVGPVSKSVDLAVVFHRFDHVHYSIYLSGSTEMEKADAALTVKLKQLQTNTVLTLWIDQGQNVTVAYIPEDPDPPSIRMVAHDSGTEVSNMALGQTVETRNIASVTGYIVSRPEGGIHEGYYTTGDVSYDAAKITFTAPNTGPSTACVVNAYGQEALDIYGGGDSYDGSTWRYSDIGITLGHSGAPGWKTFATVAGNSGGTSSDLVLGGQVVEMIVAMPGYDDPDAGVVPNGTVMIVLRGANGSNLKLTNNGTIAEVSYKKYSFSAPGWRNNQAFHSKSVRSIASACQTNLNAPYIGDVCHQMIYTSGSFIRTAAAPVTFHISGGGWTGTAQNEVHRYPAAPYVDQNALFMLPPG